MKSDLIKIIKRNCVDKYTTHKEYSLCVNAECVFMRDNVTCKFGVSYPKDWDLRELINAVKKLGG